MKRILLLGILLLQLIFTQQAEITNVQVAQRTDGSKLVDITYDLSPDALFTDFNISVEISLDGGSTWNQSFYVQGDVFAGQTADEGKAIVWNMGQEYANTFNENVQVRVIAEGSITGPPPFEMVSVPTGDYTYGSDDQTLNIDYDFEMSKYEITNAQYVAYLIEALEDGSIYITGSSVKGFYTGDEHYNPGDQTLYNLGNNTSSYNYGRINWNGTTFTVTDGYGDHPVVYVTWFGAQAFAQHYGMRLPNEHEWEKTARGNTGYNYPWGNNIDYSNANYNHSQNGTTPVGYYNGENANTVDSPSQYGAYDMAGNVFEWTNDWYNEGSSTRVWRGGSWNDYYGNCQSWSRNYSYPTSTDRHLGFRVARTL